MSVTFTVSMSYNSTLIVSYLLGSLWIFGAVEKTIREPMTAEVLRRAANFDCLWLASCLLYGSEDLETARNLLPAEIRSAASCRLPRNASLFSCVLTPALHSLFYDHIV